MAITITADEVKRKAMIDSGDTAHDADIGALIAEMQGPLQYSIADSYLADTSNVGLQATLKLGMLEIITGEFVEQLRREVGATEEFSSAGFSVGAATARGIEMIQQGATRLAPFLKGVLPMMSEAGSRSTTADAESTFSADEEVW